MTRDTVSCNDCGTAVEPETDYTDTSVCVECIQRKAAEAGF